MALGDIDWRIYYEDGSTFNSAMGGPDEVPPDGVLAIVQISGEHRNKRDILKGWDCYFWHAERKLWIGADHYTIIWRLKKRRPVVGLCDGIGVPTEDYQHLLAQVIVRDIDFPGAELTRQSAIEHLKRAVLERVGPERMKEAAGVATRAGISSDERCAIMNPRKRP